MSFRSMPPFVVKGCFKSALSPSQVFLIMKLKPESVTAVVCFLQLLS
jgi:hypothetical protein